MKAVRRPQFLTDLEEGADYLQTQAGDEVLARWRESVKNTLRLIQQFPELGRLRSDLPIEGIRTLNLREFPDYLVFYRLRAGRIEFLRVKHGMMHLPGLFESENP